jgi:hypothetical protein
VRLGRNGNRNLDNGPHKDLRLTIRSLLPTSEQ